MIDHTGVNVRDFDNSREFYRAALKPLGYDLVMEFEQEAAGFGVDGRPEFWIEHGDPQSPRNHIAFRAPDQVAVDRFYAAALNAGGRDNGSPGLRTDYAPDYYAAYVLDPDGYNIEAVYHGEG